MAPAGKLAPRGTFQENLEAVNNVELQAVKVLVRLAGLDEYLRSEAMDSACVRART